MALSEFEAARLHATMQEWRERRRPPSHIRPQLDIDFRIAGQSVEIFEIRPSWRGAPSEKAERPVAKATYIKTSNSWRVFWMRADLKWHRYEPAHTVRTVEEFLAGVEKDEHACFFG